MGQRYAERKDVYDFGLARGTVGIPPRVVARAVAATDVLELDDHGFETDDHVQFRAPAGTSLPTPLIAGSIYFVICISDSAFKVALTAGGAPVNITADGADFVVFAPLPWERVLEYCSRFVDPQIPAHAVPLTQPIPLAVVGIVATFAAQIFQKISGTAQVSIVEAAVQARKDMALWADGVPLRDPVATASTNTAVTSLTANAGDPRWESGPLR